MLTRDSETRAVEEALRRNQRAPEEVARLSIGRQPFSYAAWKQRVRPATPEELADWEEFLRQREVEREWDLAAEAGIELSGPSA